MSSFNQRAYHQDFEVTRTKHINPMIVSTLRGLPRLSAGTTSRTYSTTMMIVSVMAMMIQFCRATPSRMLVLKARRPLPVREVSTVLHWLAHLDILGEVHRQTVDMDLGSQGNLIPMGLTGPL